MRSAIMPQQLYSERNFDKLVTKSYQLPTVLSKSPLIVSDVLATARIFAKDAILFKEKIATAVSSADGTCRNAARCIFRWHRFFEVNEVVYSLIARLSGGKNMLTWMISLWKEPTVLSGKAPHHSEVPSLVNKVSWLVDGHAFILELGLRRAD